MLDDPHVGDRDPRTEDRQLLLDALLAATRPPRSSPTPATTSARTRRARRRCRSASCSTPSTARCRRPTARPRPHRRPPSAAAVRPAQLHRRRARRRAPWSFDRVDARGRRGAAPASATRPAPFLAAPLPPRAQAGDRARRPRPLRRAPRARVPAPAAGRQRRATTPTRSTTRLPVELDGLEQWGVGERLLDARLAGVDARSRAPRPRWPAARCRPGVLGAAGARARSCPRSRHIVGAGRGAARRRRRPRLASTSASRSPTAACVSGTVPGVARRRRCASSTYSRVAPAATAWPPGCGCSRSPPPTPSAASRRVTVGRGAATARDARRAWPGSPRCRRRRALERARAMLVDLYDRGHARAAAALLRDARPPTPRPSPPAREPREAAGATTWESGSTPTARTASPSTCWSSAAADVRRAARGRAAPPTQARPGSASEPRASAATRAGCGTAAARERRSAMSAVTDRFDLRRRCRPGVTVLEASAGTGKTYTIAALAARYVAEGTPLERAAARDLHPHGHGRAARARARAARRAPSGPRAAHAGARRRRRRVVALLAAARRDEVARAARRPRRARSPTSTPRRSPPPTASARRCSAASASPATSSPTPRSSRTSATSSTRSSTTSTCAASTARAAPAVRPRRGARRSRRAAVDNPRAPTRARRDAGARRRGDAPRAWPTPRATSSSARKRRARRS